MKAEISKRAEIQKESKIPIMESFNSLQGEGVHCGKPAYFIRTAGCDVGCHWCDVKESWSPDFPCIDTVKLSRLAMDSKAKIVIVTGGEPLTYNLNELTQNLKNKGLRTHLETSGVYEITGNWDWICLSPKKLRKPHTKIWSVADELKIIIYNKSDLNWAEAQALKVNNSCKLYLQPEWSRHNEMLPPIIEYVKNNPGWNISLQIHKFMDIP